MVVHRWLSLVGLLLALLASRAGAAELPELVVPDGLGVNIHFTDPKPGEMEMLAAGGFRWVRMDLSWGATEREKGQYDFSAFERLLDALEPHGIRALFILDYSNRHYDGGLSPASDEGRQAFARWAAAAAKKFQGRGILWEMYNEPNIRFWKPEPNVEHYVKLALEVGKALRAAAPGEMYIGPATSQIDMPFLEACFQAGLLDYWCAVSVHPYRQKGPETVAAEYAALRRLIAQYAPQGKTIPILSGEWGYSVAWANYDETSQGKMLPRQWLVNLANEVPVSIWYDWHDDGPDPKEAEHHFGTVLFPQHKGRTPLYDPKPAYHAAKTLTSALDGFRYSKRLAVGGPEDYVLLFAQEGETRLAAWTTASEPREVVIPASAGAFRALGHTGEKLPALEAAGEGLRVRLVDAPQYLAPERPNALLQVAAAWERAPLDLQMPAAAGIALRLSLRNPLKQPIRVTGGAGNTVELPPGETIELSSTFDLGRSEKPLDARLVCRVEGLGEIAQTVPVTATNPLKVQAGPPLSGRLIVRVENPSGEPLKGRLRLTEVEGIRPRQASLPLVLEEGKKLQDVTFELAEGRVADYRFGLQILDSRGQVQLDLPVSRYRLVDDFAHHTPESLAATYQVHADGDAKVGSTQSLSIAPTPPDAPLAGATTLKLSYRMEEGWKFLRIAPRTEAARAIEGRPRALGLWIYGDGSGCSPRLRVIDATGQTHQPSGSALDWKGWRYVEIPLESAGTGHWGGANDGKIHWPLRWDTLLLIDGLRRAVGPAELFLGSPVLVYE